MIDTASHNGVTAAMLACMAGNFECLQALVEGGANLTLKDAAGNSALHLSILGAANTEQAQCAVWIARTHPEAIPTGSAEAVEEAGKFLQLACAEDDEGSVAIALIENGCSYTAMNADGQQPLHTAAFNGTFAVVKALVTAGADVNGLDEDGEPPSFYADLSGHEGILQYLKGKGAGYEA